ncbi:aminotransferase class I/II-fold pyridoxal phosphate-dependent enzyme [Tenacibaculum dicentrarchi]|nr:aminotransferase class I/II-fold pyridoxal phosphate-dependent enzyme [Tenacibaculum dicentrarchi]MCD8424755.1 aminotransferase class I/II-fold pyridoxal phosphate-dependent enzyme [Tenacibaculum dicentrarchi]MCD8442281.1 aminotransferase class I/II-fold pyridoxal phosphate-dependent enzyme [Tenacibaculum dicentrarchi]
MLNGHGDDLHLIKGEIKHNFSSNVYYKGCPENLLSHISKNIPLIQSYPSPTASELNILAAKKFDLKTENFLFTNGATEAFYLIAQLFSNKKTAIVAPTFSEYEDSCKIFKLDYQLISRDKINQTTADLIFICNPNNPTGAIFSSEELTAFFKQKPNTIFVIDEAYIEFTNSATSIVSLIKEFDNLIIVRSLTKTFTIPGLRLGYIISSDTLITSLLNLKMPWSVNLLAVKAGKFIFDNYKTLQFNAAELITETAQFKNNLKNLKGIKVYKSNTSYFLVEILNDKKAKDLKAYLIENHQILIRDATNFKKLNGEYIRLSTQSKSANNILINALKEWL